MTAKDLTLSQVFCSDVLLFFPCHQLCVNQGFHFVGSSFILCFLERIKWPKSPLISLMGLFLRLSIMSIYTCQHPVQHHLLSSCSCPVPPFISFGMDYQITVISELHHNASANSVKGSSL